MNTKPVPREDAESAPFWRAVHEGRFVLPTCGDCGKRHFYPRALCPHCRSLNVKFAPAAGQGTIYSYTVNRQPAGAEFAADVPYVVALVTLDEGPRMLTRIVNTTPEWVKIGQRVSFVPVRISDDVSLPCFEIQA
ncbi:MAG: Zn-ribbon domain-containing OB-fold protein [Ramlibacter sp.]